MNFGLGPEIITSYKRLSYKSWYALAEFVDNSTQAYLNNRRDIDLLLVKEKANLFVKIEYGSDASGEFISIEDNSSGMSKMELEDAIIVGKKPAITTGRSKYGIGMKTAACWFGNNWSVTTKKFGEDLEHTIHVNVEEIAKGNLDLGHIEVPRQASEHYTRILIRDLQNRIVGRTIGALRDHLGSMYRWDYKSYGLQLFLNGIQLTWDENALFSRLLLDIDGQPKKRDFEFTIQSGENSKKVTGWAGVLQKGSRKDAGFTIFHANRVIVGFPESYRPETLYGPQVGGSNDLVNQRLLGCLELDDFDVSHTKDEILYAENEKDQLEALLLKELGDLRQIALEYRKYEADERIPEDIDTDIALVEFEKEIQSPEMQDLISNYDIPPPELVKNTNYSVLDSITKKIIPTLKARIGDLTVFLYLSKEMSPNDPYVIVDSIRLKESIYVLINMTHPHWGQLKNENSILNFIRHCAYDAVAEWKTYFKIGRIDPDTVKNFKDRLLRLPFEMEKHSA
ncbi:MAG: hypothetical protein D4R67_11970 [Bacteroidetes bacterium]|nr:MAG: hypothetical protein D4R67_11970 [Bacteroidota bacterium]